MSDFREDSYGFWGGEIVQTKGVPPPVAKQETFDTWLDVWGSQRAPSKLDLVNHNKNIVYVCASLNAQTVAATAYHLYATTERGQGKVRNFKTRSITESQYQWLCSNKALASRIAKAENLDEIVEHPSLDLMEEVNEYLDGFTLWELTQLYQEVPAEAYWYIEADVMRVPTKIWILPSQYVEAELNDGGNIINYKYGVGNARKDYKPADIIPFLMPDLQSPYSKGWSPARAAYESISIQDKNLAFQANSLDNRARPDGIISPKESLGEGEALRFENRINKKFRKAGAGGIMMLDDPAEFKPLSFPPRDMELLAFWELHDTACANAYGVPIPLIRGKQINRATLSAALAQHGRLAILPRLRRNEQRINQKLLPRYDPRLFIAFDNPVPEDEETNSKADKNYIDAKVQTPEQIAERRGWKYDKEYWVKQQEQAQAARERITVQAGKPEKPGKPQERENSDSASPSKKIDELAVAKVVMELASGNISRDLAIQTLAQMGMEYKAAVETTSLPLLSGHVSAVPTAPPADIEYIIHILAEQKREALSRIAALGFKVTPYVLAACESTGIPAKDALGTREHLKVAIEHLGAASNPLAVIKTANAVFEYAIKYRAPVIADMLEKKPPRPFLNYHSARLIEPEQIDQESYAYSYGGTIQGEINVPTSIEIVWGRLKKGDDKERKAQALRFPKDNYTIEQANSWLKEHGVKYISLTPAKDRDNGKD